MTTDAFLHPDQILSQLEFIAKEMGRSKESVVALIERKHPGYAERIRKAEEYMDECGRGLHRRW